MDPIWTEIDHTLVRHKLSLISQEMQPKSVREIQRALAVARKSGNSGSIGPSLVDAHVALTDEWIDRVYQAYCEVWVIQGNSKSARFIREVFERAVVPLIEVRQGAICSQIERMLSRKPGSFQAVGGALAMALKQLQGKWRDKLEIEAGSCKYEEQRQGQRSDASLEDTLSGNQGPGANTAGNSVSKAPPGDTGLMSPVPSDPQAYRSVWHQIDHELVKLKTQDPLTKHIEDINAERNSIEHNTTGKRQAFVRDTLQMVERRAEEWIGIQYDIYCEVWKLQGQEKSADFLRTLRDNIVESPVRARMKTEIHHLTSIWKNNGYPAIEVLRAQLVMFERAIQQLEHKWKTRLEIEAREWEYTTTARASCTPVSASHDRNDAKPQARSGKRPRKPRSKSTAEKVREARICAAIAKGRKGLAYCFDVQAQKIVTRVTWRSDGCPKEYPEAYEHPDPRWRELIQKEKNRYASKMKRP
jgi:hypothetical protein